MKTLTPGLAAALASGVTTLCRCWKVIRRDGLVFGFTNHDRPVTFNGITFEPESGFMAAETETRLGLAVDTQEAEGVLSSDTITETDIALGLWDLATVTLYLVDWSAPENRAIERAGVLGEISRGEHGFSVEVRGLAHALNQETGRTYQRQCDAVVGDGWCKLNLTNSVYKGTGAVTAQAAGQMLTCSGLSAYAAGWFSRGVLTWTSGANVGAKCSVDRHVVDGGGVRLALTQAAALLVEDGDSFTITVGCENTWAMCQSRFANGHNFRGFPHIPGNDFALSAVKQGAENDGGSLFK